MRNIYCIFRNSSHGNYILYIDGIYICNTVLIENIFNYKKTILEKIFNFWEEKKSHESKLKKYESWKAIEINLVKLIRKIFVTLFNVAILIIICIIKFHCKNSCYSNQIKIDIEDKVKIYILNNN